MSEPKFPDEVFIILEADGRLIVRETPNAARLLSDNEGLPFRRYIPAESETCSCGHLMSKHLVFEDHDECVRCTDCAERQMEAQHE